MSDKKIDHAALLSKARGWADQHEGQLSTHIIEALADALEASVQAPAVEAFIVRDVDGTSFTGMAKVIGVALRGEDAEWHAAEVKKRDSWHEGSIVAVPILRAQDVREGK